MRRSIIALAALFVCVTPAFAQMPTPPQAPAAKAITETQAWAAIHKLLPRNTAMDKRDGQWFVRPPGQPQRAATPAEAAAIDELEGAILAQRAADRAALRAALTEDERAAIDAADTAIRAVLPDGASHKLGTDGAILVTLADKTERAPTSEEQPALTQFYALADQVEARLRLRDIDKAPLRILVDNTLAGAERTIAPRDFLWMQPLVFSRNAALANALATRRGSTLTTIEQGAKLFVVAGPKGQDAYCLPRVSGEKNLLPGYSDWFPCFFDTDGDGALDKRTNGGRPSAGLFLGARGFKSAGMVLTPAHVALLPLTDGFRQRVGPRWAYTSTNEQTGAQTAYFELAAAPEEGPSARIVGMTFAVPLDSEGRGQGEALGARFAIHQRAPGTLDVHILRPLPEQPFGAGKPGAASFTYELQQ